MLIFVVLMSILTTSSFADNNVIGWAKICTKVNRNDICNVQYNILTNTGHLITGVNLLQSTGRLNRRIFQIAVPSGRYVPEGIKMKIDNGKESTLPYSICLSERCVAEVTLTDSIIEELKTGNVLVLTSTNFRTEKNPVNISLKGFTDSFEGPPLKRHEFEERNQKLERELRKKAEKTLLKLEEVQEKAKSGG
ncbi:invasion associated locus B family protein [Candidatus Endowatersipora endosymbiont of Watersipora subatra]|uniref:invasion associated locus B family protein n=1 Tax=Candidatus Endowatersipora endosymbiont of Watersipora subatra TaxID=3077946 RepID=UPI00312C7058